MAGCPSALARHCLGLVQQKLPKGFVFRGARLGLWVGDLTKGEVCVASVRYLEAEAYIGKEYLVNEKHAFSFAAEAADVLHAGFRGLNVMTASEHQHIIEEACIKAVGIRERLFNVQRALVPQPNLCLMRQKKTLRMWFGLAIGRVDVCFSTTRVMKKFELYVDHLFVDTFRTPAEVAQRINSIIVRRVAT